MTAKMTDDELFVKLSESLGITPEEVRLDYLKMVETVKEDERFKGIDESQVATIARNRLVTAKRRELASPAITWEGVVLAVRDLVDTIKRQRELTAVAFKLNPEKAQEGWLFAGNDPSKKAIVVLSDDKGTPLYPKTDMNVKFRRAGTPLPKHSWLRNIDGVAAPVDKKTRVAGAPRRFAMTINLGAEDTPNPMPIPMNAKLRFKGIDKTTEDDVISGTYRINASSFTKFELAPDLKLPPMETILAAFSEIKSLADLDEVHQETEKDYNRIVVVEGNVSLLNLEPNPKTGNLRMVLDDESLLYKQAGEGQSTGTTTWIPTDRGIVIDFGQDSRVYAIGRTNRGKKMDPETRKATEEPGDVMLNVYGIYCPEIFKVNTKPELLTGKSLEGITIDESAESVDDEQLEKTDW